MPQLDMNSLNEVEKQKMELEQLKQELHDVRSKIKDTEIPDGFRVSSIAKYKKFKLSDRIEEKNVYGVKLENEKKKERILLYKLKDDELLLIATINEKKELLLSESHKKLYKKFFSQEYLDKKFILDENSIEKDKIFELDNKDLEIKKETKRKKKSKEKETDIKDESRTEEEQIASTLGVKKEQILNVVEIHDEKTMSNVLNKNMETKNLYAVKLKQDSGGIGSNDWIMINKKKDGRYERAMKEDPSDTIQDLAQTLNIKNDVQNTDIKAGDISSISKPNNSPRQTEVNRYRFSDGVTIVLETDRTYNTVVHAYKEAEDGKLTPLCADEHEEHEENVELPDRNLHVEEEEEEKTPWGDAQAKRNRY